MIRILSTADKNIIQPPKKLAVKQKAQDFRGTDKKIGGGEEREDGTASREKEETKEKNRNED